MSSISILLLTKDESENLKKWREWLPKLKQVNEVIAIDDHSTDDTLSSLKKLGIKTFNRGLNNNFSAQRNFAITKAKNDWVLFIDPDEEPSVELIESLNQVNLDHPQVYSFKRHLIYNNHLVRHGQAQNDYPIRLFPKNSGKFIGTVHETWRTSLPIKRISTPIYHHSAPNLKIFLQKLNLYSTLRANELFAQKKKTNIFEIILYTKGKFLQTYFWQLGFLDGLPGLIICLSLSFYSFLVRSKLWRLYHA